MSKGITFRDLCDSSHSSSRIPDEFSLKDLSVCLNEQAESMGLDVAFPRVWSSQMYFQVLDFCGTPIIPGKSLLGILLQGIGSGSGASGFALLDLSGWRFRVSKDISKGHAITEIIFEKEAFENFWPEY